MVAEALRKSGAEVRVHSDHFPADAKDHEWLPEVGRRGWVVLTKDTRIRYHTIERDALMNAGVGALILAAGNISGPEMAMSFVKAIPSIRRFIKRHNHRS